MIEDIFPAFPHIFVPPTWYGKVAVILWILIVVIQMWGNSLIDRNVRYGAIAYKFLKTCIASVFGFIVTATLLRSTGTAPYVLGFTGVVCAYTFVDFLHIRRRNKSRNFFVGKTLFGWVNFEDREQVDLTLSAAASILRHERADEKPIAGALAREELLQAMNFPSGSEMADDLRRQAKERREKLARKGIRAVDVEILKKEIDG